MALAGGQGFGVKFSYVGYVDFGPRGEESVLDGLEPGFLGGATGGGMKECNHVGLAVSVKKEVGLCVYLGWGWRSRRQRPWWPRIPRIIG